MKPTSEKGFTLYELLTTVLIVGVVLALGVPNMTEFRQNSRMSTAANDLHSSFHFARSEAARAKANVTICASNNSQAATPACAGQFEDGWIVFADTDGDVVVDPGENVLRRFPAMHAEIRVTNAGQADYFAFGANGQGRGNVTGTPPTTAAVFCDARGNTVAAGGRSAARVLVVTPLGRPTVLRELAQVTFHGGC